MKRVTAFIGSARKKSTYNAVCQFLKNLQSLGDIEYEIITLSDYRLGTCIDTIKSRTSCRTFKPVPLSTTDKRPLEAFIRENDTGLNNERIPFIIIEKKSRRETDEA